MESGSDRLSGNQAHELINAYMIMLTANLKPDELRQFAVLIKRWRGKHLAFSEFLQKVLEVYGSERKHLLARMRPFVHGAEDVRFFNRFLELSGISDNAETSMPSYSPASDSLASRSFADSSAGGDSYLTRGYLTTPFYDTSGTIAEISGAGYDEASAPNQDDGDDDEEEEEGRSSSANQDDQQHQQVLRAPPRRARGARRRPPLSAADLSASTSSENRPTSVQESELAELSISGTSAHVALDSPPSREERL